MRRRNSLHPLAWILIGLFLLTLSLQTSAGQRLMLAFSPVMETLAAPARWWQSTSLWFQDSKTLQSNYLRLKEEHEQQAAMVQEILSLREENRQLRSLLLVPHLENRVWQAVKVEGRSPDTMSQRLVVAAHGLSQDDVVVSRHGLVGLVDTTSSDHAVVRTVLDASLAVPVTMESSPLAALVRGQGDSLIVDFVPWVKAPAEGSILHTSGAGGLFPPGIPVAKVTRVRERPGEVFAEVEAEPLAHWRRENWLAAASLSGQH